MGVSDPGGALLLVKRLARYTGILEIMGTLATGEHAEGGT
jgi:hypothetical protein